MSTRKAATPRKPRASAAPSKAIPLAERKFDARRDTPDLRDDLYVPTLVEVPTTVSLASYRKNSVPILDQGREGACTGFGLATVANYLLRRRKIVPDKVSVSPHMLYRLARRYDEWPGEEDAGSSARGAMKGWHKHGVCALDCWKEAGKGKSDTLLTTIRAKDALERPLGAYFRVNHGDLVAMHAALAEVGILYATSCTHAGWDDVGKNGVVHYERGAPDLGGHAFAIVAYDRMGFWIQNSWGPKWGREGFCHITYEDWLTNGTDVWVARLGVPVDAAAAFSAASSARSSSSSGTPLDQALVRPHIIGIGNNGVLRKGGILGTDAAAVENLFGKDGEFDQRTKDWPVKRLLVYAHGGLNDEAGALQRVQDYRKALMDAHVYPVAFIWKTDYWTTICNVLDDAKKKRRPEGALDATKDFMFNRLDDGLEPIARGATGKLLWDEMKENAVRATTRADGGARFAAQQIAKLMRRDKKVELHFVGHSAGSIFHGPMIQWLTSDKPLRSVKSVNDEPYEKLDGAAPKGENLSIKTVALWAPACTIDLFRECYEPAIKSGRIGKFALFTLTDKAEQDDDCGGIYHKSLLYLVSHALEVKPRIPMMGEGHAGTPLLGMEWWLERRRKKDPALDAAFKLPNVAWVTSPSAELDNSPHASQALHHGAFDDDGPTLRATLLRVLGTGAPAADKEPLSEFQFEPSARRLAQSRREFMR